MTAAKKTTATKKPEEQTPPEPIESELPTDDGATADASPTPVKDQGFELLDFKRSGPEYDLNILDNLVDNRRGDLKAHRDAINEAIENADNRSEALSVFKEDFESHRVLNMPVLNEAVLSHQSTAMDLRGQLWKIIKSLPQS